MFIIQKQVPGSTVHQSMLITMNNGLIYLGMS